MQNLDFAGAGGIQALVEDIAGLLHVLLRGLLHFAVVIELGLHFERELHAATDIDTVVHAVEEEGEQREGAQTDDEESARIALHLVLFCGKVPEEQHDEQNACDEIECRSMNDAL